MENIIRPDLLVAGICGFVPALLGIAALKNEKAAIVLLAIPFAEMLIELALKHNELIAPTLIGLILGIGIPLFQGAKKQIHK